MDVYAIMACDIHWHIKVGGQCFSVVTIQKQGGMKIGVGEVLKFANVGLIFVISFPIWGNGRLD